MIYFLSRIESGYPDERVQFVTNICNRFIQRSDQYVQNQSNNDDKDVNNDYIDIDQYLFEQEQPRYYRDEDIYDAIEKAPFHITLSLFGPYIIQHRFMCPIKEVSDTFTKLIEYINQVIYLLFAKILRYLYIYNTCTIHVISVIICHSYNISVYILCVYHMYITL